MSGIMAVPGDSHNTMYESSAKQAGSLAHGAGEGCHLLDGTCGTTGERLFHLVRLPTGADLLTQPPVPGAEALFDVHAHL